MNDTLNTPAPMSDEQRAIDDMSQENLSQEDREALGQLQSELNQDRIDALPRGNPVHLDAQGNVLTEEEYQEQQKRKESGERDEYGHGGSRS